MDIAEHLTASMFFDIISGKETLEISSTTRDNINNKRQRLLDLVGEGRVIYGVNTGVGSLKDVPLERDILKQFQTNLIRSHAESVGPTVNRNVVKGAMVLLAHSLGQGLSGVSLELLERLVYIINNDYVPEVGYYGSVGASGDLSFLASMMLAVMGERPLFDGEGKRITLETFSLTEKEGLAVINGTHFSLSHFLHLFYELKHLEEMTRWVYALHLESRKAIVSFLDPLLDTAKPDPFVGEINKWLRSVLSDSRNVRRTGEEVQEPYVIRCFPQIYASVLRTIGNIDVWLDVEMNTVSDNPLFKDDEPIFQGNFHAESIAMMANQVRALLPLMANVLYQLQEKLLNPEFNRGLPPFLAESPGLDSGLMIVQYLSADLSAEISLLSSPVSMVNQTMSTGQEDIVSFAPASNRLLQRQLELYRYLLAATVLTTGRAVKLGSIKPSLAVGSALSAFLDCDLGGERSFSDVIERFAQLI
ncbi:aromatic amino acid ammonia-lyase [Coprothermobacter platensis]|uniref:aromatic amino acid ammonia-lyase n=1 Tax=Coprothermobacter platensis TaxID=108819 RepID=UPI000360D998|nr:aromatic amino acid ammonia-lyase [Coprothermobacter platensis]